MLIYFVKKYFHHISGTVISIRSFDRYIFILFKLNIYSFYKTKGDENKMSFKNEIFRKGNENNFFLIQRGRKYKDL